MRGLVDPEIVERAKLYGIDLSSTGFIRRNDGRVFLTNAGQFPIQHSRGGALRARVVWWLATGEAIQGTEFDIHHKNHVRSDDRIANLEKWEHHAHAKLHNPPSAVSVERTCLTCGKTFAIVGWRLKERSRGRYCSQDCYKKRTLSAEEREKRSKSFSKVHRWRLEQTACWRGHPWSVENTYCTKNGTWVCKTCRLAAQRRFHEERRLCPVS